MHAWLFVNEVFELKHAIVRRQYKPIHRIFGVESLRTFVHLLFATKVPICDYNICGCEPC